MYRKQILKEVLASLFPVPESDFWPHVIMYEYYSVQYGQVIWYYNRTDKVIAIRDGENCFYISSE